MIRFIETFSTVILMAIFMISSCTSCYHFTHRTMVVSRFPDIKKYHTSITKVLFKTKKNNQGYRATAFAITKNHLITAGHFCDHFQKFRAKKLTGRTMELVSTDNKGSPFYIGEAVIVANSKSLDLCLIKSENHKLTPLKIVDDFNIVETEDPITVIGAPAGALPSIRRDGKVISSRAPDFPELFQDMMFVAIDIEPGSSGSPVIWFDQVIGVIVILPSKPARTALAVRGDDLSNFIKKHLELK